MQRRQSLKEAVASVRVQHRWRIHAIARWSLATGRPVPMEHAALFVAAEVEAGGAKPEVLRSVMGAWCGARGIPVPSTLAASLQTCLQFVAEEG
jgi:hypothetical protein